MHTEFNSNRFQFIFYSEHKRTFMFLDKCLPYRSLLCALVLTQSTFCFLSVSRSHFALGFLLCFVVGVVENAENWHSYDFLRAHNISNFTFISEDRIWFRLFDSQNANNQTLTTDIMHWNKVNHRNENENVCVCN